MKKFLAIILAIGCIFASLGVLTSCGGECTEHLDEDGDNVCDKCKEPIETVDPSDKRSEFTAAMSATNPAELTVTVTTTDALGSLSSVYNTVFSADGSFVINYSKESFADLESDDEKVVKTGTISCSANGTYSDGSFSGSNPLATGVTLDLSKLKNFSTVGDILTATVAAADTQAALGVVITNDATLVLTKNNGKIVSVSVTTVDTVIVCEYK